MTRLVYTKAQFAESLLTELVAAKGPTLRGWSSVGSEVTLYFDDAPAADEKAVCDDVMADHAPAETYYAYAARVCLDALEGLR